MHKFIKLLKLTQSDNDNESLNAIRFANDLLKKQKLSWEDIIFIERLEKEFTPSELAIFTYLKGITRGSTKAFIESLWQSYLKWGSLTEKQHEALLRVYERVQEEEKSKV